MQTLATAVLAARKPVQVIARLAAPETQPKYAVVHLQFQFTPQGS